MTFTQLEQDILRGMLPWAARVYASWWSNAVLIIFTRPQAHAWLDAGWRVASVDRSGGIVTFERFEQGGGFPNRHTPRFKLSEHVGAL
jgi:hypothetical protein